VYAAGDITGAPKQIVVAVAHGSIAAMTAFEDLTSRTWLTVEKAAEAVQVG
jgi:thioredoxin reductase (NADPH)